VDNYPIVKFTALRRISEQMSGKSYMQHSYRYWEFSVKRLELDWNSRSSSIMIDWLINRSMSEADDATRHRIIRSGSVDWFCVRRRSIVSRLPVATTRRQQFCSIPIAVPMSSAEPSRPVTAVTAPCARWSLAAWTYIAAIYSYLLASGIAFSHQGATCSMRVTKILPDLRRIETFLRDFRGIETVLRDDLSPFEQLDYAEKET